LAYSVGVGFVETSVFSSQLQGFLSDLTPYQRKRLRRIVEEELK